jgi:hypothetical protein
VLIVSARTPGSKTALTIARARSVLDALAVAVDKVEEAVAIIDLQVKKRQQIEAQRPRNLGKS